jgi:Leucine-rich repeat (LRR) protein
LSELSYLNASKNPLTHIPTALRQKKGLKLLVD